MFKTRLLSGILLVIIALATIISGDYVLFFTLLAVSLIGMRELYRAMKVQDEKINLLAAAGNHFRTCAAHVCIRVHLSNL